jgi:hypothetical protein
MSEPDFLNRTVPGRTVTLPIPKLLMLFGRRLESIRLRQSVGQLHSGSPDMQPQSLVVPLTR